MLRFLRGLMSKYSVIFDALKNVRGYSERHKMDELLQAVKFAEDTAMIEICNVDLEKHGSGYDAIMHAIFPDMLDTRT